eukprot:3145040-Rhodomonas_salina.1
MGGGRPWTRTARPSTGTSASETAAAPARASQSPRCSPPAPRQRTRASGGGGTRHASERGGGGKEMMHVEEGGREKSKGRRGKTETAPDLEVVAADGADERGDAGVDIEPRLAVGEAVEEAPVPSPLDLAPPQRL